MSLSRRGVPVIVAICLLAPAATAQTDDLDPREANVLGADWLRSDGEITFWVTMYKDAENEDGVADHWQVESRDGETLFGRHDIAEQPDSSFTTNGTFTIPSDTRYVVVRGHDSVYGYGGQAVVLDLGEELLYRYQQGSDPVSFASSTSTGNSTNGTDGFFGGGGDDTVNVTEPLPDPRTYPGNDTEPFTPPGSEGITTGPDWSWPFVIAVGLLVALALLVFSRRR